MELFETREEYLKWTAYQLPLKQKIVELFEQRLELTDWDKTSEHYKEFQELKDMLFADCKLKFFCDNTLWTIKFTNFLIDLLTKEVFKVELNNGVSPFKGLDTHLEFHLE